MNWPDERYVKFYVRDTYTWRAWPWQARALLGPLMKAMNGAGVIEFGNADPAMAIGVMVLLPIEVVEIGIAAMIGTSTLERIPRGFLMPNFLEAQEATKTEAAKKRDQRERARDVARAQEAGIIRQVVPSCPELSRAVPLQPSPAQPSPAHQQPAGENPPAPRASKKSKSPQTPPDPRHAPLVAVLATTFEAERRKPLAFDGYQARAVTQLLALAEPAEVEVRYRRALRHRGFPVVATPAELRKNWDHFATEKTSGKALADPAQQSFSNGEVAL